MTNGADANSSIAVLIDASNANPSIIGGLLAEVAKLGLASVKRIYGDWTRVYVKDTRKKTKSCP